MIYTTYIKDLLRFFWADTIQPLFVHYKKQIIGGAIALILILWIGTSWGFFRLPFFAVKAIEAIPENTAIILETKKYQEVLGLIETKKYANDLFHVSVLEKWKKDVRFLDSLFQATKSYPKLLKEAHLVSGVQISSRNNADWLFVLDNYPASFDINVFIEELMPKQTLSSIYRGQTIYQLNFANGQTYSLAFFEGLILASPLTLLVESGIEQLDNISTNVSRNSSFRKAQKQTKITVGKLVVYINFKSLSLLTSVVVDNKKNIIAELGNVGEWISLDARFLNEGFLLSGHFYPLAENKFLKALASQEAPAKSNIAQYLPKNTAILLSLGWSDPSKLYHNSKIEEAPDFEENILPWLGREAALVIQDPIDDDNNFENDFLVFLQTKDTALTRQSLAKYGKIKTEMHQNFDINQLVDAQNILQPLYGTAISPISSPYYTIIDNYVVFGNSPAAINRWVEQFNSGQTLQKAVEYKAFLAHSQQKSNIYLLCSTPKSMKFLKSIVRPDLKDYLEQSFLHFRNIYPIGIQFHGMSNHYVMTLSANHNIIKEQVLNQSSVAWAFDMTSNAAIQPQPVFDASNKQYYILAQDSSKRLYFINNNGQNLWGEDMVLPDYINSKVFEIDYHNNGEMQFAFSTRKSIYVLDKDAQILKKINLVAPTSTGLLAIDYGKGPRFFVPCQNGGVYGFDKNGQPLNGWQPNNNVGNVHYPMQYMKYEDKDYLLAVGRAGACKAFKRNSEAYFRGGKLGRKLTGWDTDSRIGRIAAGNKNGKIHIVNTKGKGFAINAVPSMKKDVLFAYADVVGDSRKDYIRIEGNQLAVHYYSKEKDKKGKTKDEFKEYFVGKLKTNQQQVFGLDINGYSKQYIGTVDSKNRTVSVYNAKGVLQNGFPLAGTSKFDIVDLFNENGNTLVVANNNQIYAYKVKL